MVFVCDWLLEFVFTIAVGVCVQLLCCWGGLYYVSGVWVIVPSGCGLVWLLVLGFRFRFVAEFWL